MKIAFIVSSFPCLSESFIVRQITGILDNGHDVRIFAFSRDCQVEIQNEVKDYQLIEKTTVISLPQSKWILRIKGICVLLACLYLNPKAAINLLLSFKSTATFSYRDIFLTYYFLKGQFDVVHAHFGPNGLDSLCLKRSHLSVKHVTTFHGYDVTVYVYRNGKNCYQELFYKGDCFMYNSEATRKKLLLLGCPQEKMKKIPMGVDTSNIVFQERHFRPGQVIRLLSVGRLVEMKGREYAIRAAARLAERHMLHYDIIGEGPLHKELQSLIDELKAGEFIKIWGWVSSDRLKTFYHEAHLFVHPSVTSSDGNQEGQGVVLLEAQAHGIPVVSTDHGAFPDSVINGKTGFLVPERDVESLVEKIDYLIKNCNLWPQIGRAGREYVERTYEIGKLNKKLIEIYEEVLM